MNIKFDEPSRVAGYRIALGLGLHAAWRGVLWFFVPEEFDPRRLRGWHGSL